MDRRELIWRSAPLVGVLMIGAGVWGEFGPWVALIVVGVLILADAFASAWTENRKERNATEETARTRATRKQA